MVIMALDHVRDYFHEAAFTSDPENIDTTTSLLFFTRFITHFCAPVFIFLAGTSAFLYGQKRSKTELSKFLIARGIWLVFVEIFIMNFLWWFDITYSFLNLQVIWAIGWCMVVLGIAVYLPKKLLLFLGLLIVLGHNGLDSFAYKPGNSEGMWWYFLHQIGGAFVGADRYVQFTYPILPWIGVIFLGFSFGELYKKGADILMRKRWLLYLGLSCIGLFIIVRFANIYGNLYQWETQETLTKTVISFFKLTKYPPSLQYLLITLGPAFLLLYFMENIKNSLTNFFRTFGRVPFFYYIIHVFAIHIAAIIGLIITNKDWTLMIITRETLFQGKLGDYGYNLGIVYLVWIGIVLLLYPICRKYMRYKAANRDKWWLSYL